MRINTITPEQTARFAEWTKKWVEIGLSTEPADFDAATAAALRGYQYANLKKPMVVLRLASPFAATIGGALAVGLLGNKEVGSQVWSQVWSQVRSQVWSQVESQVRSQVGSQVESQVGSQVWSQVENALYNYGCNALWASWPAYVSFFRDVIGWKDAVLERFEVDETLVKSCGWTWWHENVLAISDRPEAINRDASGRLHSESQMAIRYRDGWGFYSIHGVIVPEQIVMAPETITKSQIESEGNAEVKRIMLAKYGYERYLRESDAKLMDSCAEDHPIKGLRTAKLYQLADDVVVLDMLNSTPEPDGTVKRYVLAIDGERYDGKAAKDCHAAMASTWRIKGRETELLFKDFREYRPAFES